MDNTTSTPTQDVGRVLAAVRRRWRPAGAIFVLVIAATLVVSRLGPSHYEATAQILLQPPDSVSSVLTPDAIPSAANAQRDVNTNAELITSIPVADAVRRQLHMRESSRDLIAQLSVAGEATSNLVEITASDRTARHAAQVATAVALQYQRYRRASAQDAIDSAIKAATARVQSLGAAGRASSQGQTLQDRLQQLEAAWATTTGGVQVVRPAAVPSSPAPRLRPLTGAAALILALLLAGLAIALLERVDRRLLDETVMAEAFGMPVIARLAKDKGPSAQRSRQDALARVALRLRSARAPRPDYGQVIMVAPATRSGSGDVPVRLTEAFADLAARVLLIEADLRRGANGEPSADGGLTAVLRRERTVEQELVVASYGDDEGGPGAAREWKLLPAGRGSNRPLALVASAHMHAVVTIARSQADVVVVAAPALASCPEATVLSRLCDDIVLVAHERSATRDDAELVREQLSFVDTRVAGLILDRAAPVPQPPSGRAQARRRASGRRRAVIRGDATQPSTASA